MTTAAATARTPAPIATLQTGHIGLNVSDIARSKQFYQQIFGFETTLESEESGKLFVFLTQGDRLVLTLWQQSGGTFAKDRPGLHHLSFQVDSVELVPFRSAIQAGADCAVIVTDHKVFDYGEQERRREDPPRWHRTARRGRALWRDLLRGP